MNRTSKLPLEKTRWVPVVALLIPLLFGAGVAMGDIVYVGDGAVQNAQGGFDIPAQGTCPGAALQGYTGIDTRPECVALRLNLTNGGTCVSPNYSWSTGLCNDLVNTTQVACEGQPDRLWNPGTSKCAIVMMDDDRNNVVCALHGGTWETNGQCTGSWVMPDRTVYNPPLLTSNGTGDQCLRCHNSRTQYNGPRVRDTEDTMYMGHKNMARKVTVGMKWGGPPFHCTVSPVINDTEEECFDNGGNWVPVEAYPGTDSGQDFDWVNGTIDLDVTAGTNFKNLYWIYGDWLSAYPRAIYADDPDTAATPDKPKVSYSCGRCHTTGWTSDATLKATKEPEKSFPGITWDGVADATFGQVNLAGGVTGDTNKMSSWDVWGISCARCHGSAVDNTTNGGVPPFTAVSGMSAHHSSLTSPDAGSGYCTSPNFSNIGLCNTNGGTWLTACSIQGACSNVLYTDSLSCFQNGGTWTPNGTLALCTTAGGTFGASSCSVAGVCNNPTYTTQATCEGAGAQWAAATDVIRCEDAGGRWTGNKSNRGQVITALCMECHRQETGGKPYDSGTNPAGALKVGLNHGTPWFLSHYHGNQFLNSPHGKFTGTSAQIATGKFSYAGTGEYKSFFMTEAEQANVGNGCTGCHEVHTSTVAGEEPFRAECTECHAKDVNLIAHPTGVGTPIESKSHPNEACFACHMPEGLHLFRIKADAAYTTIPSGALTGTVNANTSPDGTFASAVWVDLDMACGQCHGGGNAHVEAIGSMTAGSPTLTVPDSSLFTVGQRIEVPGAGGYYYDDLGVNKFNNDLEGAVKAIASPTTLTLTGNATVSVASVAVEQNPVKNNAAYFTKAELEAYAKNIHRDKPMVYFSFKLGSPNTLTVNVNASASTCSGSAANCDAYDWSWGDASADTHGVTSSHTYSAAGTYPIKLTVHEYGVGEGEKTQNVTVYAPDLPPTVNGSCTINPDTWVATVTDTPPATDDQGVAQIVVNWGDNSVVASDTTAPFGPFTHTYAAAGSFTVTRKVIDTIGQQTIDTTCVLSPAPFTISGRIFQSNGTTGVTGAVVTVKKGLLAVRNVVTDNAGNYSATGLKPGTYSLTVKKGGYVFPVLPASATVGPNAANVNINAVTP